MLHSRNPRRPIRVLVVADKYLPDQCGGAPIYADMCRGLAGRGFDVTVRCPYPYYPEWADKGGCNGLGIRRTVEDGVKVERYGLLIPPGRTLGSVTRRLLVDASYFLSLARSLFLGGGPFDVAFAYCPLMGGVAFAALHKLLFRTPLLLSAMDLPVHAARAGGIVRSGRLLGILLGIQKALFNRADVWRSIAPAMIERLEGLRARGQPIRLIPDWLHPSVAESLRRLPSKRGRPAGRPVRLLYSGNIGAKQGLLDFCTALHASPAPFTLRIQGDGAAGAQVRDWVASCGDARFSMGPLVAEAEFARALHEADLFLVTEKPGGGASFFPSKMIPGMTSGTPCLAVSDPDSPLGREMRDHAPGPWFSWDRCDAAGPLLETLAGRAPEFLAWQRNAAARGRYYERERCLDLIQETLEDMVRARTPAPPEHRP